MHRDAARLLELGPKLAARLKLEIIEARMIGNLSRRDRQWPQRNSRELHVDEIANFFGWADFYLAWKSRPQCIRWQLGVDRKNETRGLVERGVGDDRHP